MILFLILAAIVIGLIVFAMLIAGTFGSAFILIFSDVIVCAFLVIAIIKFIFGRKKNSD